MRHRNGPGNGYRPNALAAGGMAAASRISPEGSMRGQRTYNTEYRSNNIRGGYGRGGRSKQFQPLPPRETDIFMEAGRLAAEYLVSKGVLPPDALSGKWLNDDAKEQMKNYRSFRHHEVDKTPVATDGHASGPSNLANSGLETGSVRRRYSDEYTSMASRFSFRGRKRTGPLKTYGSEMKREFGRSGSWAEKSGASLSIEADRDTLIENQALQSGGKDGNDSKQSSPGEAIQVDSETSIKSEFDKHNPEDDVHANNGALSKAKNLSSDADGELIKRSDDSNKFNDMTDISKGINDNNWQQKNDENKAKSSTEDNNLAHVDLLKHCKFANVCTKARSPLKKGPKGVQNPMNGDGKISNRVFSETSEAQVINVDVGSSSCNDPCHHDFESLQSNDPSIQKELGVTSTTKSGESLRAPESAYKEKETDEVQSPNSMFMERGVKRAIDYMTDGRGDSKKIRHCVSTLDAQSDSSSHLSCLINNQPHLQGSETAGSALVTPVSDQKVLDVSLVPKCEADSVEFMEEKQLFPGSFKTCDLNLSGTCDVGANHEPPPTIIFPSVTQPGEAGAPIDVDLSMGSSDNLPEKNSKHGIKDMDIEVIDLENDSAQDHKVFDNPEKRADTLFNDLVGFPSNMHNSNGIPDVQDGYGLMISELLANESPSSSSVHTDLNSLNNHMGLPNTEGMLGDDESIYMSLGEIPISLLGPWEQPMQDYGKPY